MGTEKKEEVHLMRALTASLLGVIVLVAGGFASSASGGGGVAQSGVTVDFSTHGVGFLDPDFYRSDGIVFPPQRCGSAGCFEWEVGFIQGDDALGAAPPSGPVEATFTRPTSDISLRVAPQFQGTATYTLRAFAASGELLGTASRTVTQDFGDPETEFFGYFTIALSDIPKPAKRFTLDNVFVRDSFGGVPLIPYGVSSISFKHWGNQP
jgi:hypothetical protein